MSYDIGIKNFRERLSKASTDALMQIYNNHGLGFAPWQFDCISEELINRKCNKQIRQEFSQKQLEAEANKKLDEEIEKLNCDKNLEKEIIDNITNNITKDVKIMDRDSEEDLDQLNERKMYAFYNGNLDDVYACDRMMDKIKESYNKNKLTNKKEDANMANETKNMTINTKIDVNAILQAKMAEKMMDAVGNGKDIPLAKMTIMQGITSGKGIDINEIIQAKQTEKLLKDLDSGTELTIGKLLTYQALTQGDGFDLNALIQAKFVEKLFDEDEKTAE